MGTYDRQIATVSRLLKKFGGPIQIIRQSSTYAPGDAAPVISETTETVNGVRVDEGVRRAYQIESLPNSKTIGVTSNIYLEPKLSSELLPDDVLILDGTHWRVVISKPLSPNGQVIMHQVIVQQ